jgi:integrase
MRGSVVKRTDSKGRAGYFAVVEERADDGKRRRRWRSDPATGSAFTSKKAAEAYIADLVSAMNAGNYVEPSRETLGSWLDSWLKIIKPTVKPSTWASYEKNMRLHVKPHLGSRELRRLNAADLDKLYSRLLTEGRADHAHGTGLSPRTVRYVATILGRALKDATRKGLIPRSPAADADPPSAKVAASKSSDMHTWTGDQMSTFLAACHDHRYGPVFAFLAGTGCRRGEALGLRWRDVDLDENRASIVQSVAKVAGKVLIGDTKSSSGRRVALDAELVAMLREHRTTQLERRLLLGTGWRDHDLVFAGPIGEPIYPETVSRSFKELVDRLGLPAIRLHDLRHTWATIALGAGIHPKVVQERLGHANVSITLNIYSHVAPTLHDDAADTVARLMRGSR